MHRSEEDKAEYLYDATIGEMEKNGLKMFETIATLIHLVELPTFTHCSGLCLNTAPKT